MQGHAQDLLLYYEIHSGLVLFTIRGRFVDIVSYQHPVEQQLLCGTITYQQTTAHIKESGVSASTTIYPHSGQDIRV